MKTLACLLTKWTSTEKVTLWGEQGQACYDRLSRLRGQNRKAVNKWDRFTKGHALTAPVQDCPTSLKPSRSPQTNLRLAPALQVHFKRSQVLTNLTLLGVHMTQDCWELLGEGFSHALVLTSITLVDCGLTDVYMGGLVRGISDLRELNRLELSGNDLESGYAVGRIIENHGEKRDEAVWAKGLRSESAEEDPKGLQEVVLASNQLNDQCIEVLTHVLNTDIWLKALDLRENKLTEAGIARLSEVLQRNKTLLYVDLRGNAVATGHNLLRVVYNSLRRNYLRYEKGNGDGNDWKQRLLSMLSCIEPTLEPPRSLSPNRASKPSISPSPLTGRDSSPLQTRREKPCSKCHLLSSQLADLTREVDQLRIENDRLNSLVDTWAKQGKGEDSVTMSRIEQMMTEVSRMMGTLEQRE